MFEFKITCANFPCEDFEGKNENGYNKGTEEGGGGKTHDRG